MPKPKIPLLFRTDTATLTQVREIATKEERSLSNCVNLLVKEALRERGAYS